MREMYDKVSGTSDKDWSEIAEQYTDGVHPIGLGRRDAGLVSR